MRSSQLFGSANTLLTFTNTGFRTINPGDAVLLGYDGNVSAPLYRANYPVTNTTSGNTYTKNSQNAPYLAGYGKMEFPATYTNRDFVYDAETDSLYGYLDGSNGSSSYPYWTRISRTNGNLNNTVFSVSAIGANNGYFVASGYQIYPSQPVKIVDNGGASDVWMVLAGSGANAEIVTCNGSTGAMITYADLVPSAYAYNIPFIKVQNGYGVSSGATIGGLQAFSVTSAGAITIGTNQPVATLGIAAGGSTSNVDLIPLGNTGTFLYFRSDIGNYGTMYVVTLNTSGLTFTINATYALTAAQAAYTGRDGSGFIFSALNANNQIVLYQRFAGTPGGVVAGALTLITYAPGTKTLTIGNVVPILGSNNSFVSTPTPITSLSRCGSGAHSYYDGYNFYYIEANCHLKIPFTGTAITPNGIVAYSKAYTPLQGAAYASPTAGGWGYASNGVPAGVAYIPMFFPTIASSTNAYATGYWTTAEESLDNTFAYGVEIGVAVTGAAKGASVTVAVKSAKLSSPLGTTGAIGAVGALSENGASIFVTPTLLYAIADFDLIYPRLPSQLTCAVTSTSLADTSLSYTSGAPAYKSPPVNYGPMWNGLQNYSVTKIENTRQSVFLMNSINFAYLIGGSSSTYAMMVPLLMSFDGIFMPQAGYVMSSSSSYLVIGTFDNTSGSLYAMNRSANWSFRNEFGFNRYDNLETSYAYTQLRYQTKD